jgi:hypothetical protein
VVTCVAAAAAAPASQLLTALSGLMTVNLVHGEWAKDPRSWTEIVVIGLLGESILLCIWEYLRCFRSASCLCLSDQHVLLPDLVLMRELVISSYCRVDPE